MRILLAALTWLMLFAATPVVAGWIEHLMNKGKVWFATMEEIAAHVKSCRDDGIWQPRIEEMPYYEGRIAEWEPTQEKAGE